MQKPIIPETTSATAPKKKRDASGRVQFDSRGQAVWAWEVGTGIFDLKASTARVKSLAEPAKTLRVDATKAKPTGSSLHDPLAATKKKPVIVAPPLRIGEDPGGDPYASSHKRK